jgi:hypothetical protein
MQRNVNDGLGFGIFEKVDKGLGLGGGTRMGRVRLRRLCRFRCIQ